MPDMKNKLMHMIQDVPCDSHLEGEGGSCPDRQYGCCKEPNKLSHCAVEKMAERLIAGGVVIPVRCKECKCAVGHDGIHKTVLCQKRSAYPKQWDEMPFDGFCSYGERRKDET